MDNNYFDEVVSNLYSFNDDNVEVGVKRKLDEVDLVEENNEDENFFNCLEEIIEEHEKEKAKEDDNYKRILGRMMGIKKPVSSSSSNLDRLIYHRIETIFEIMKNKENTK